jgi:hypothetical protein
MDDHTLIVEPLDPLPKVINFVRDIQTLRGHRLDVLRHSYRFLKRYRPCLSGRQMALALSSGAHTCLPLLTSEFKGTGRFLKQVRTRTYVSTTEPLYAAYTSVFNVLSKYESYFKPTMVTDRAGTLSEDITASCLRQPSPALRVSGLGYPCNGLRAELA